jgi:ribosomal protein S27E
MSRESLRNDYGHTVRCDGCGDPAVVEDHAAGFAYCQYCHDQNEAAPGGVRAPSRGLTTTTGGHISDGSSHHSR